MIVPIDGLESITIEEFKELKIGDELVRIARESPSISLGTVVKIDKQGFGQGINAVYEVIYTRRDGSTGHRSLDTDFMSYYALLKMSEGDEFINGLY